MGNTRRITQVDYVIKLGDDKDYKIRPLSLVEVKDLTTSLKGLDNLDPNTDLEAVPGLMDTLIEVCSAILVKANPKLKDVNVGELVNVADIKNILAVGLGGEAETDDEVGNQK